MHVFPIVTPILYILFLYTSELIRAWFLWLITYAVFSFFINLTSIVITEGKIFHCTSFYSFELLCSFRCSYAFYYSSTLTLSTVSSIITLFSTVYISSIFKPLLLLWSLLKCLSMLESLIWPLLPKLLSIETLVSGFLRFSVVLCIL